MKLGVLIKCALLIIIAPKCTEQYHALSIFKLFGAIASIVKTSWEIADSVSVIPLPYTLQEKERIILDQLHLLNDKFETISESVHDVGALTTSKIVEVLTKTIKVELRVNDLTQYMVSIDTNYRLMTDYAVHKDGIERSTLEDFAQSVIGHDSYSIKSIMDRIYSFIVPSEKIMSYNGLLTLLSDTEEFPHDINYGTKILEQSWIWNRIEVQLRNIYALYETFRRFQKQQTAPGRIPAPRQAWIDLVQAVLNATRFSVPESLENMGKFVEENKLFLEALKEMDSNSICMAQQSPQQILYNLYNTIAVTELKGYTMVQFSYMLLKLYGKGNYTKESKISNDRFKARAQNTIAAVKYAMERASKDLWRCDPRRHIAGQTYLEITQLLQGYVQNEVDLNSDGTCRENCAEYSYTKSYSCYQNLYCRQQRRCKGKILNCRYIDSDMWICPSDLQTHRRYEYIEYENGRVFGRKQNCPKGRIEVESWWRWLFWHCSYCMCLCDEEGIYSDRYFSLRPATSDMENNRVVTGLRFVKDNRIIHLQIQEGELLPHGIINNTTVHWAPIQTFKIQDPNVYDGKDYHTLRWEGRAIDLDDLAADEDHVLTGVKFKKIGSHLNFEILIAPFDFKTGKLIKPLQRSFWKDNSNTEYTVGQRRTQIKLNLPDVPTRSTAPSRINSKSNQYIEFTHTDFDKDAAQTTVPFLDAQPVESLLPVPLSGAGIYYKNQGNFGGFIGPKIITYDYSKHLSSQLDLEDDRDVVVN